MGIHLQTSRGQPPYTGNIQFKAELLKIFKCSTLCVLEIHTYTYTHTMGLGPPSFSTLQCFKGKPMVL